MTDKHESPDERMERRRARRWKRRARILGPFLGTLAVFATLALSVDLVEYTPEKKTDRLSDRPIQMKARSAQPGQTSGIRPGSVSSASVVSSDPIVSNGMNGVGDDALALDMTLPATRPIDAPTPPSVLRGQR